MPAELPERPLPNSYWVYPGKFLAGEHPRRGVRSANELRERLRALMDAGIDSFIDLTMPEEFEPYDVELPPSVRYTRRPIRDHGLPVMREQMVGIVQYLERELRHQRRVYVHCHAGIGRTGTVAGCLLAERGSQSPLNDLNDLWQRCDRSRTWPYVPETDDQIAYVRDWKPGSSAPDAQPHLDALPLRAPAPGAAAPAPGRGLQDRFEGALMGLAIGDALATATQGLKPGSFTPVSGPHGGGALDLPPGAWSDDTATALCIAESLLECGASDPRDQVQRFTDWQQEGHLSATGECVGITAGTARALAAARWRRQIYPGSHDPSHVDPEVLSRVAPAVMFAFGSVENAQHLACEAARITCQTPAALDACRLLAACLHAALSGEARSRILDPDVEFQDTTGVRARVAELREKAQGRTPRAGSSAAEALAAALWAFESATSFADGALRAANLGGGCDVVAAVYGQLAGAHFGAQGIPAAWRSGLVHSDWIEGFAERLLGQSRRR